MEEPRRGSLLGKRECVTWPQGERPLSSSSILGRMAQQRPALFAVDIRLGEGKRKGQRWNKEMTVDGFRTQSPEVKSWEITITSRLSGNKSHVRDEQHDV